MTSQAVWHCSALMDRASSRGTALRNNDALRMHWIWRLDLSVNPSEVIEQKHKGPIRGKTQFISTDVGMTSVNAFKTTVPTYREKLPVCNIWLYVWSMCYVIVHVKIREKSWLEIGVDVMPVAKVTKLQPVQMFRRLDHFYRWPPGNVSIATCCRNGRVETFRNGTFWREQMNSWLRLITQTPESVRCLLHLHHREQ